MKKFNIIEQVIRSDYPTDYTRKTLATVEAENGEEALEMYLKENQPYLERGLILPIPTDPTGEWYTMTSRDIDERTFFAQPWDSRWMPPR